MARYFHPYGYCRDHRLAWSEDSKTETSTNPYRLEWLTGVKEQLLACFRGMIYARREDCSGRSAEELEAAFLTQTTGEFGNVLAGELDLGGPGSVLSSVDEEPIYMPIEPDSSARGIYRGLVLDPFYDTEPGEPPCDEDLQPYGLHVCLERPVIHLPTGVELPIESDNSLALVPLNHLQGPIVKIIRP